MEWNNVSNEDKKRIEFKIGDDGSFFMEFRDFCEFFTNVQICRIFKPQKYLKQIFEGEFKKGITSGGYFKPEESPQYLLKIKERTNICISLLQSDKKVISNNKKENICHGLKIYKTENCEIENGKNICFESITCSWDREIQISIEFQIGNYIIMPHTYKLDMESKYWLRIFGDKSYEIDQLYPKENSFHGYNQKLNSNLRKEFLKNDQEKNQEEIEQEKEELKNDEEFHFLEMDEIELSEDKLKIKNISKENRIRNCFSSKKFYNGKHSFSIKILKTTSNSNILIGFSEKKENTNECLIHSNDKGTFGFYSNNGASYYNSCSYEYGQSYGENDEIGIQINFETREVEFYLNGKSLGVCFNNIKKNLCFFVALYSENDEVLLNPNEMKINSNSSEIGIIKHGERIVLKSNSNHFLSFDKNLKMKSTFGIHQSSILKVHFENEKFKFEDMKGNYFSIENEIYFKIKELNDSKLNGYLFQTKNGDYLTIENDSIGLSKNSLKKETRIFPILLSECSVYQEFKENDSIVLINHHQFYFGFENGKSKSFGKLNENCCKFIIKKSGDFFKLKLSNEDSNVFGPNVENESFFFIKEKDGYLIENSNKFLSISKEGEISWKSEINNWDTRFYLKSIEINPILSSGHKIAIKSKYNDLFIYYDDNKKPKTGKFDSQLCIFTIGKNLNFIIEIFFIRKK